MLHQPLHGNSIRDKQAQSVGITTSPHRFPCSVLFPCRASRASQDFWQANQEAMYVGQLACAKHRRGRLTV